MAAAATPPVWHQTITKRLRDRDAREVHAFHNLFSSYAEVRQNAATLRNQLAVLRIDHAQALELAASAKAFGSPDAARRLTELEGQVRELKDERSDLYKTQGQNAQKLLELMESVQKSDINMAHLQEENAKLTSTLGTVSIKLRDVEELIREKDHVIEILRDELATHQLELVQREEQLAQREKRVTSLEEENRTLIERWIVLKQEQAARMNEANEYVEQYGRRLLTLRLPLRISCQLQCPQVEGHLACPQSTTIVI
ncbi:hypothetical protein HKX48_001767 [Thoreauomyces humboldtii]|nr:hypothetical protein HKX48_001767 [Thoreauomyces humboldtii]